MEIKTIMVVGAGQMGGGIAQVAAQTGYSVYLNDISQELVDKGLAAISGSLDRMVKKEKISADDKAAVLDLDRICPDHVILSTNTSSIPIGRIAAQTSRPDKVIGMHFMNPVPVMKLVEIINGLATAPEVTDTIRRTAEAMGKTPVECRDVPGFVSNRVLMVMLNEALWELYEGVASAEGIDQIMKLGMNHPMGPLALADLIGLDTVLSILEVLQDGYGDPKYRPCPLLKSYVNAGWLGRKSGRGVYTYK